MTKQLNKKKSQGNTKETHADIGTVYTNTNIEIP